MNKQALETLTSSEKVMPTKTQKWDQFSIKAEVQRRGLNLTGIARAAGLYEAACRQGVAGGSRAGAEAIAEALDIPFRELFPTRYSRGRYNEAKPSTAQADRKAS